VVTIGALIGMAAHLDGKGVTVLDMTGLAQKGGSVFSHIRIADRPEDLHAVRIATGEANAVIGGDLVVTASVDALAKMAVGHTHGVVNCAETPTSEFTRNPDWPSPRTRCRPPSSRPSARRLRFSTPAAWPPSCSATPSPPTCSCSATPGRRAGCR
jgi:Pyruvate/2-oxoacid:ferredoxin oxidoreductase gamma subunit